MIENNYINDQLLKQIADELNIKVIQIKATLDLIANDATVPFIARYRKEVTGGLNEEQIRAINDQWEYGQKLAARKEDVIRLIEEKGKLTDELRTSIVNSTKLSEIEDIYRPFKEKKKTRATDAKAKGLEPLAQYLLSYPKGIKDEDVQAEAEKYVTKIEETDPEKAKELQEKLEKEGKFVKNVKEALQGAEDIIAEQISDEPRYRKWLRSYFVRTANIASTVKDIEGDTTHTYEMYYDYEEPIKDIKAHRILALDRGEDEKILKVFIKEDEPTVFEFLKRRIIGVNDNSATTPYVYDAMVDAYRRLIKPSIEREVRAELKEKGERQAIHVFSENLKKYLLTPPMKGKVVLGIDPAFRTGCKLAVVDETGKFIDKGVMYPHQKNPTEVVPPERYADAEKKFTEMLIKYNCTVVAMGNGTASRETEAFVANTLKKLGPTLKAMKREVQYIIVNEAGASVYSASKIAQEEFPDFSVEERSAVSIARRLQDPLSELVKIDPKSIGVGQYQYDVDQKELGKSLDGVVEEAVNSVGVNVNSASVYLLQRVSGLTAATAKKIVAYRDENGAFKTRKDLEIKGLTPKVLEQAVGFLRIPEGTEKLDITAIHPESYAAAEAILAKLGLTKDDIGTDKIKEVIKNADRKALLKGLDIGEYTFNDILDAFVAPLRDPRDEFDKPILKSDALSLDDLLPGMELQGTVRNVVDFGVFVDCGVHEDGLVHISKIKKGYIKHPLDVVSVGQIVKVWVVSVSKAKNRLELTMINPNE